jgi:hypothetical protein
MLKTQTMWEQFRRIKGVLSMKEKGQNLILEHPEDQCNNQYRLKDPNKNQCSK